MIAQLFQALDMRASGCLTKRHLKSILGTYGRNAGPGAPATRTRGFVSDSDVQAIIRRMDTDGDDEVSFSDFFSSLLPYFIFNDPQALLTLDKQVDKAID